MTADIDHLTDKGRQTRARLLDAAEQEMIENGRIEVTSVADQAEASLGLLYRYFDGKDALATAVVDRFYDRYEEAVFATPAPAGSNWLDHESQRIEREVRFLFSDPLSRRIVGATPAEPGAAHADARRLSRHIAMATRNLEHGRHRGEIETMVVPRMAAATIIGSLRSCLGEALAAGSGVGPDEVIDTVRRISSAVVRPV